MEVALARPGFASNRFFPLIEANLYESSMENKEGINGLDVAFRLLRLANTDFTFRQRYLNSVPDSATRIARIFFLHRQALKAELEATPKKADFFWTEARSEMKKAISGNIDWGLVAGQIANDSDTGLVELPDGLERRIVDEVFIDAHCGFLTGTRADLG